ncbi:protoporphyrinogen/coproporphyrinogen oxidase [Pengzhenrongella frigida]|uniref:FAD-binding protein n=1 Tax=Pengzhenrongella frigida TaxID=1259133 RepID=A0A4V1ZH81_9MICO|nr:FAD-dependent oxidoreductase [Cellulomonas sp. HLT2-17]RYV51124.1 FAD-binding protein [Cellulomonas sp. HLT2-17]
MNQVGRADATVDAIVVGGGIAGLVAARELALRGLRTVVLEAWVAPGGAVGRHTVAGLELDAGADSFATRDGIVAALATELGLGATIEAPTGRGAWVQLPTGAGTLPRTGILGIPAHPWARDVRGTIGLLGALRATADRRLPAGYGTLTSEGTPASLGALVGARMGHRVLDRLVTPIVSGVHAADPNELDLDTVAPGLRLALAAHGSLGAAVASIRASAPAGSAVAGLTGGLHGIIDALATDVVARGGRIETRARVTAIARSGSAVDPDPAATGVDRWVVTVAGVPARSGSAAVAERALHAPLLVLALPGPAAADLLGPLVPALAQVRPETGADVVLATLVLDAPALDAAPRGTGVLVAPGVAGVRAKALTHATAKWAWLAAVAGPGRHVVRLSYGQPAGPPGTDPATPDIAGLSLAELTTVALRDASTLLGVDLDESQVLQAARVRWSQSLPKPSPAHRAAVAAARAGAATLPGLAVCGSWVAGNGLAAVVAQARTAAAALPVPVEPTRG